MYDSHIYMSNQHMCFNQSYMMLPSKTGVAVATSHCKMRSMKFIQNYHNEHTKIKFGMFIVVILYDFHTSHFVVHN